MEQNKVMVAMALVKGSDKYPDLYGKVILKQEEYGVVLTAEIYNLPVNSSSCPTNIFSFHIHEGGSCTGNSTDPFLDAKSHYNPKNCPHPDHAGDLLPLLGNNGYAYLSFLTNRFNLDEVIGRVIIIHDKHDDFISQPSGNSGNKIACGKIVPL